MTATHTRMLEPGDDREAIPEISQRGEILGQFLAGARLLRNERVPEDAQRQTEQQQPSRLFSSLSGMDDATKRFEPRQTESDAGSTKEAAAGGEGGLRIHGYDSEVGPIVAFRSEAVIFWVGRPFQAVQDPKIQVVSDALERASYK